MAEHLSRSKSRKLSRIHFKKSGLPKVCSVPGCSSTRRVEIHHNDYQKPYEYILYCKDHHEEIHRQIGFISNNDNEIFINVEVPDEWNVLRKSLHVTWMDIIKSGLKTPSSQNPLSPNELEPYIKSAVKQLSDMWNHIKERTSP